MYELSGVKTYPGHEGEACSSGKLKTDGKVIGDFAQDTWSGPTTWNITDQKALNAFGAYAKTFVREKWEKDGDSFDEADFNQAELIALAIDCMAQDYRAEQSSKRIEQSLRRLCKTRIVYVRLIDGQRVEYELLKPFTQRNVENIRSSTPDLVEILNEKFGMPFISDDALEELRLKKLCKTKLVFRCAVDGKPDEIRSAVGPYSKARADAFRAQNPQIVEVVNERYL